MVKNFIITAFIIGWTAVSFGQKTGYINSDVIIANMPETAVVIKTLEDLKTKLDAEIQVKYEAYQKNLTEAQQAIQKGMITPIQRKEIEDEIKKEQDSLVAFEQQQAKIYDDKTLELYQPVFEKVNKAIQDVGKENGYQMILDSKTQVIIYSDGTGDLSKLVAEKLGIKTDQN